MCPSESELLHRSSRCRPRYLPHARVVQCNAFAEIFVIIALPLAPSIGRFPVFQLIVRSWRCKMDASDFTRPPAQPILPPGHPPLPKPPALATYTLESLLATAAGSTPKQLVAVKGAVYDVTPDARFQPGGQWQEGAGRDMTRTLAFTPVGQADDAAAAASESTSTSTAVLRLSPTHQGPAALSGLDFDQQRILETWNQFFEQRYDLVGRLLTQHEIDAEAAGLKMSLPGEAELEPMPSDVYGSFLPLVPIAASGSDARKSLHALIDAEDEAACWSVVVNLEESFVRGMSIAF